MIDMDTGVVVAIVTGVAALIGTIISAYYTQRIQRPSALKTLYETLTNMQADLDEERARVKALRDQIADMAQKFVKLENRIFEVEEKERAAQREMKRLQRKNSRNLEIIKILLQQLEREGLVPDAKPDTGELA